MSFNKSVFKERFYNLRRELKMSQNEFADFLDISNGSVGGYETGAKTPNCEILVKISKKLNVSTDYLLGLSSIETPNTNTRAICEATGLSEKSVDILQWCMGPNGDYLFDDYLTAINFFIESQYNERLDELRFDNFDLDAYPEISENIFYNLNLVQLFSSYLHGEYRNNSETVRITDSNLSTDKKENYCYYDVKQSDLISRFLLDKINDSLKAAQAEIIKRQKGGEDNG